MRIGARAECSGEPKGLLPAKPRKRTRGIERSRKMRGAGSVPLEGKPPSTDPRGGREAGGIGKICKRKASTRLGGTVTSVIAGAKHGVWEASVVDDQPLQDRGEREGRDR